MKWTQKHEALLSALRGDDTIPSLYRALSHGRYHLDEDQVARLRDWVRSLATDPAWPHLERSLDSLTAWPETWNSAVEAGFSPLSDHHNALVLREIAGRFASDGDYKSALRLYIWHVEAFQRLFATDYPLNFVADVDPQAEGWEPKDVFTGIFRDETEDLIAKAKDAYATQTIDRGQLKFAASCLDFVAKLQVGTTDSFGAMTAWKASAVSGKSEISRIAQKRFDDELDAMDWTADNDTIAAPFERLSTLTAALTPSEALLVHVVTETVEVLWKIRHVGNDESDGFKRILAAIAPLNEMLAERVLSGKAFGHNSKCADFMVFEGELISEPGPRSAKFKRGLEVCPGHRNCLMLLSYVRLHDADVPLVQLETLPSITKAVPGRKALYGRLVGEIESAIAGCEEIFAHNKSLPEYKERLQKQKERLGME